MIYLGLVATLVLLLIGVVFPDKKETTYGCIVAIWKAILFIFIFILLFVLFFACGAMMASSGGI